MTMIVSRISGNYSWLGLEGHAFHNLENYPRIQRKYLILGH